MREFLREPEALFWALVFPVLITTGLGVAFRNQAEPIIHVAATTPDLASALRRDARLVVATTDAEGARDALRRGTVSLVVQREAGGTVTYLYDDTNPDARVAKARADDAVQAAAGRVDPVDVRVAGWDEPGSRYVDFLVPGLVGMGIMGNAIWGLGFAIVDARRRHLMKRIVATPMRASDYLLSFLLWRLLLLVFEVGIPVGFGMLAFGVPMRGSVPGFVALCVLGSLAFSALGLLIASRARTIEAVSGIMNLVMMPMWILSGVFFSAGRFPEAMQPFIRVLPLTALNDALRATMLQGVAAGSLLPQIAALLTCLLVSFGLAMRLFRWQ
jgi:ABC-type multidrug transport system permease subunit